MRGQTFLPPEERRPWEQTGARPGPAARCPMPGARCRRSRYTQSRNASRDGRWREVRRGPQFQALFFMSTPQVMRPLVGPLTVHPAVKEQVIAT